MIIFNCEIKRAIQGKSETRIPGIEYCEGWHDFKHMGISVICAYDFIEDQYRVFMEDNFAEFQRLVDRHRVVAGYNSVSFDNRLCEANGIRIREDQTYDLVREIWAASGLSTYFQYPYPSHLGYGLNDVIWANWPTLGKSGNGALDPVLWQRGKIGRVVDYCLNEVRLTVKLMDRVINEAAITDPVTGLDLHLRELDALDVFG